MNRNIQDVETAATIDPDLLRRREQLAGQPSAQQVWSEAVHVATLNERARDAFIEHAANSRGADIVLRLLLRTRSTRDQVAQTLMMNGTQATLYWVIRGGADRVS